MSLVQATAYPASVLPPRNLAYSLSGFGENTCRSVPFLAAVVRKVSTDLHIRWTSPVKASCRKGGATVEVNQREVIERVEGLTLEGDWEIQFNVAFKERDPQMKWFGKEKCVLAELQEMVPTEAKFSCTIEVGGKVRTVEETTTTLDLVKQGLRSGAVLKVEATEEVIEVPVKVHFLSGKEEDCSVWLKPASRGVGRCVRLVTPFSVFCDTVLLKEDGQPGIDISRRMSVNVSQGDRLVVNEKKQSLVVWHRGAKCAPISVDYGTRVGDVIEQLQISGSVLLFSRLRKRFLSEDSTMSEVYVPGDRIVAVDDITVPEGKLTISQRIGEVEGLQMFTHSSVMANKWP